MSHRGSDRRHAEYVDYTSSSERLPLDHVPETDEIRRAREIVVRVKATSHGYRLSQRTLARRVQLAWELHRAAEIATGAARQSARTRGNIATRSAMRGGEL